MKLRETVQREILEFSGQELTDELFRMAANEADKDIRANHLAYGIRTSPKYVIYVMVTTIMILQRIDGVINSDT